MTAPDSVNFTRTKNTGSRLSWQGLHLSVPEKWNPLKLDGDDAKGSLLLADLHRSRLAVRWSVLPEKTDPEKWSSRVMTEEVGALAASEAVAHDPGSQWAASRLYVEPDPPGRDVWVGMHRATRRGVEVVYQAKRRDRVLVDSVLPGLYDTGRSGEGAAMWSVFDLNFTLPRWIPLVGKTLNAGDLSLSFADKQTAITVRQVAVAQLALKRFTLEQWLGRMQWVDRARFKPVGEANRVEFVTVNGRALAGWSRRMVQRRRYAWMRWAWRELTTLALHDVSRDRLIFVQGTDPQLPTRVAETVGDASNV